MLVFKITLAPNALKDQKPIILSATLTLPNGEHVKDNLSLKPK